MSEIKVNHSEQVNEDSKGTTVSIDVTGQLQINSVKGVSVDDTSIEELIWNNLPPYIKKYRDYSVKAYILIELPPPSHIQIETKGYKVEVDNEE